MALPVTAPMGVTEGWTVPPPAAPLTLQPGRVAELAGPAGFGLTRLGLFLLAPASRLGPVVAIDVRGWFSPRAAWEVGIVESRLVVARCPDRSRWSQVTAAVMEGVGAVYAEVPTGIRDHDLRRLAALARSRRTGLVLRPVKGGLPSGVAHLRLQAAEVRWEGVDRGHGRLLRRRLVLEASGKGMAGIERRIEVEDDGADGMRVVSGLGSRERGRSVG